MGFGFKNFANLFGADGANKLLTASSIMDGDYEAVAKMGSPGSGARPRLGFPQRLVRASAILDGDYGAAINMGSGQSLEPNHSRTNAAPDGKQFARQPPSQVGDYNSLARRTAAALNAYGARRA